MKQEPCHHAPSSAMSAYSHLLAAALLLGCNPSEPQQPTASAEAPPADSQAPTPTQTPAETPVSQLPDVDASWNYGDPTGTETAFREFLGAHPDAPLPWRLELRTQIARTHSLRDQFAQDHAVLDAIDIEPEDGGEALTRVHVRVRSSLERGRC